MGRKAKLRFSEEFASQHNGLHRRTANNFIRIKFGNASDHGDFYGRLADALTYCGKQRPIDMGTKEFACQHVEFINKFVFDWEQKNGVCRNRKTMRETNDSSKVHIIQPLIAVKRGTKPTSKTAKQKKIVAHKKAHKSGAVKFYTPNTSVDYRKLSYDEANSPNFLESREWKALRMAVLAKYGNACMCCGAKPDPSRNLFANVDHIIARRKRPDLSLCFDNLQVLCSDCNGGKLNWDETDWRPKEGKTPGMVIIDEPRDSVLDDLVEYVDMATVRIIRDIAK